MTGLWPKDRNGKRYDWYDRIDFIETKIKWWMWIPLFFVKMQHTDERSGGQHINLYFKTWRNRCYLIRMDQSPAPGPGESGPF